MSTNFYLKAPAVDPILDGMDIRIHVGKFSGGHVLVFQAHDNVGNGIALKTTSGWREFINYATSIGWSFIDEYGGPITAADFWTRAERSKTGTRRGNGWNDEGFDFIDGDFF